jgi:hypothetical protein
MSYTSVLVVGTNSYVTVAEAAAYFTLRLDSAEWTEATDADKDAALAMACKAIDRLPWAGYKYQPDYQVLAFPRVAAFADGDSWTMLGVVRQQVRDAQCEEALAILRHQADTRLELMRIGLTGAMIDGASEQYKSDAGQGLLSVQAKELLRPWSTDVVDMI